MKSKSKFLAFLTMITMLIVTSVPMSAHAVTPITDSGISMYGMNSGQQSGYYINTFNVTLAEGGDNGSAVFRLYTNNASDVVSVKVTYIGTLTRTIVAQADLQANNGAEQTVYFLSGKKAKAGTYEISYTCYTSALNPIKCWICSWN